MWHLGLVMAALMAGDAPKPFSFRHHMVDDALPGGSWGQTALVDLDRDGDLDFITARSGGEVRWYRFEGRGKPWKLFVIGERSPSDVGGVTLDVDGDGRLDFVVGGGWYRQPEDPTAGLWPRHIFDPNLPGVHDVQTADIDGDGRTDVITMSDRNDVRYYTIAVPDPTRPWTHHRVGDSVHAGLSVGDIDGDGDIDIVRSQVWFENRKKGTEWKTHAFCSIPWADRKEVSFYYLATRSRVEDINRDGRKDIVLTEAEFSGARIAWFEAPEDPTAVPWKPHILPQEGDEKRGPYHSLQVADFDLDGDLDIFSGEMERFGQPPHRWFIWENKNGDGSVFVEHVILDKALGTHETVAGDVDGDGDIDLVGKLWSPVPNNGNHGRNHVDYLENLLR